MLLRTKHTDKLEQQVCPLRYELNKGNVGSKRRPPTPFAAYDTHTRKATIYTANFRVFRRHNSRLLSAQTRKKTLKLLHLPPCDWWVKASHYWRQGAILYPSDTARILHRFCYKIISCNVLHVWLGCQALAMFRFIWPPSTPSST